MTGKRLPAVPGPDFRSLFEAAPGLYLILAPDDLCIVAVSDNYLTATMTRREDIVGRFLFDVFPDNPNDPNPTGERNLLASLQRVKDLKVADAMPIQKYDVRRPDHDGGAFEERYWSPFNSPVLDTDGNLRYIIHRVVDVTEMVRLKEQQVEDCKLSDELRQKDEFLAMLAHELRNPLAAIKTALQISNTPGMEDQRDRSKSIVERQVGHLAHLIDDLMDVARISRGKVRLKRQRCDIGCVIERAMEVVRPLVTHRQHSLTLDLPPEPIFVDGDPTRLEQVFVNLIGNAAKFTPKHGQIGIAAERAGDEAVIRVSDSGVGIEADMLATIFEQGVQASRALDRSYGGLGIGLTLVKSLAELHQGSILAESGGLNCGSTFTVRFPAVDRLPGEQERMPQQRDRGAAESPVALGKNILVVDDNRDAADNLTLILKQMGYSVTTAYDGISALEAVKQAQPHVVLLDIGLPEMDGYEVARRLRREGNGSIIIAVTGYGQEKDRELSRQAGFNFHFVKPVDIDELERHFSESTSH